MKTKRIVICALLAALTCVATIIIKVPLAFGYVNLGDCCVLLSAYLLPLPYGALAAAIGSALADVLSGYFIYAPATFIIKGAMALCAYFLFKLFSKHTKKFLSYLLSAVAAEIVMILGYFAFEAVLYGIAPAAANMLANGLQGAVGIVCGLLLIELFNKIKIFNL